MSCNCKHEGGAPVADQVMYSKRPLFDGHDLNMLINSTRVQSSVNEELSRPATLSRALDNLNNELDALGEALARHDEFTTPVRVLCPSDGNSAEMKPPVSSPAIEWVDAAAIRVRSMRMRLQQITMELAL